MFLSIFMVIAGCVLFLINAIIGFWIYKDAKNYDMDAPLWAILKTVFLNMPILIIYLIVRKFRKQIICPVCAADLKTKWIVCPNCGEPISKEYTYKKIDKAKKPQKWRYFVSIIAVILTGIFVFVGIIGGMFGLAVLLSFFSK